MDYYNSYEGKKYLAGFQISPSSNISLVPPREDWPQMQSIRTQYMFDCRTGPHISMIDFFHENDFDVAEEVLTAALANMPPFTVTFSKFDSWKHDTMSTVLLVPETNPPNLLHKLMNTLLTYFPQTNSSIKVPCEKTYNPHMSIAKFHNEKEMKKKMAEWQKAWKPMTFVVKELYFMTKIGVHNPFEVKRVIPIGSNLAKPTKPYFGPNSIEDQNSKIAKTAVVINLKRGVTNDELLKLVQANGFKDTAKLAEVIVNPDGKARGFGVVEFETAAHVAEASAKTWNHQDATLYVRPLSVMLYPDVVNGCCTFRPDGQQASKKKA